MKTYFNELPIFSEYATLILCPNFEESFEAYQYIEKAFLDFCENNPDLCMESNQYSLTITLSRKNYISIRYLFIDDHLSGLFCQDVYDMLVWEPDPEESWDWYGDILFTQLEEIGMI